MKTIESVINKSDVISIVGAGGKTSLMFYLANKLYGKKIIATSTKILYPKDYNIIIDDYLNFTYDNETIVTAKKIIDKKIAYINEKSFLCDYDYMLIEADGSKELSLKGWNETEPVIIEKSNKTIGIIDIKTVGLNVNSDNIFRLNELEKITNLNKHITINNLFDIVKNKNGLFKNTNGKKILFINKVESDVDLENAKNLHKLTIGLVDNIFIGSIHKGWIYDE